MKLSPIVCSAAVVLVLACKQEEAPKPPAPKAPAATVAPAATQQPTPAAAAAALAGFEGEIDVAMTSADKADKVRNMTLFVKNGQLRFDIPVDPAAAAHGKVYQIINVADGKVYSVSEQQKVVMEMDSRSLADQLKGMAPTDKKEKEPAAPPKVTKTGQMDTVAGYKCEEWDVTTAKGGHQKICVANESASWLKFPFPDAAGDQTWAKDLFDGSHFPVRFVNFDAAGKESHRVEVTKLERKTLPLTLFEIPADYHHMDMGAMMGGMMGGMRGMPAAAGSGAPSGAAAGAPGKMPAAVQEIMRKMREQQKAQQAAQAKAKAKTP